MDKLIKWIEENSKEEADIQEAKQLVEKMTPQSREEAERLIDDNRYVKAELDSRISKSVDNAEKRINEEKLPKLIEEERKKIEKELNQGKEETPQQKEIRILKEQIEAMSQETATEKRKAELRAKAKEIGMDIERAERYVAFGDKAEDVMQDDLDYFNEHIKKSVENHIKEKYAGRAPEAGDGKPKTKRSEIEAKYNEAVQNGEAKTAFMLKEQLVKMPKEDNE